MIGKYREWQNLRDEIRAAPVHAETLDEAITEALYRYRIHLTKLQAKPTRLDRQVWESYDSIIADIRRLFPRSQGRLIHSHTRLQSLLDDWHSIYERQTNLVEFIDETIERSSFYNKMETAKDDHSRRREEAAQVQLKLSQRRRSVIRAIHYILLRERSGESITSGSMVLDLGLAISSWQTELAEIFQVQGDMPSDHQDEVARLEKLRLRLVDAGSFAEALSKVEQEFDTLLTLEDQYRSMTGNHHLSEIDVNELVDLLRVDAKEYWAGGEWDELGQIIERVERYVQREIGNLQSHLYVVRKRKGHTPLSAEAGAEDTFPDGSRTPQSHQVTRPPETEDPEGDKGGGLYEGSLRKALRERHSPTGPGRVYIDPDADESIHSVFHPEPKDNRSR